jgi:hypothetical protein
VEWLRVGIIGLKVLLVHRIEGSRLKEHINILRIVERASNPRLREGDPLDLTINDLVLEANRIGVNHKNRSQADLEQVSMLPTRHSVVLQDTVMLAREDQSVGRFLAILRG